MKIKNIFFLSLAAYILTPPRTDAASSGYHDDRNPTPIEATLSCGCVERLGTMVDTSNSRHRSCLMDGDSKIIRYCALHRPQDAASTTSLAIERNIVQEIFNQILKFETESRPTASPEKVVAFRAELNKKIFFSLSFDNYISIKKLLFEYDQEHCGKDYENPLFADYFTGAMPRFFADWHLERLQTTIQPLVEHSEQFLIKEVPGDQINYDLFVKTAKECTWYIVRIGVSGAIQKMLSKAGPLLLSDFMKQVDLHKKDIK